MISLQQATKEAVERHRKQSEAVFFFPYLYGADTKCDLCGAKEYSLFDSDGKLPERVICGECIRRADKQRSAIYRLSDVLSQSDRDALTEKLMKRVERPPMVMELTANHDAFDRHHKAGLEAE